MKKIVFFLLMGMAFGSVSFAEELVVNLKSGNSIVIKYTGAIQGVTLKGSTDAIEAMNIQGAPDEASVRQVGQPQGQQGQIQGKAEKVKGNKDGDDVRWFKLRWAAPKRED
ncbi:MAG: hypothetical protein ACUVQ6_01495 [Dissulfurimicrobium sp.]|uniref:hypothetical protein n=1 Tax=Dissulfurimicrobium sp. TaxID=2022436 RepID=UPI00404AE761